MDKVQKHNSFNAVTVDLMSRISVTLSVIEAIAHVSLV
jgi:hypothetical protein